jgi:EAL domain-containing protein (putative c-di-GMP-specific phosphodiesterase class I)
VAAIIRMAGELGMGVVAEGVETVAQRDRLAELGCRLFQGYLFGRPTPRVLSAGQRMTTGHVTT